MPTDLNPSDFNFFTTISASGEQAATAPLAIAIPGIDIESFVDLSTDTAPADRLAIVELWRRAEAEALLSGELVKASAN